MRKKAKASVTNKIIIDDESVDTVEHDGTIKKLLEENQFVVTREFKDTGDVKFTVGREKDSKQFNVMIAESKT